METVKLETDEKSFKRNLGYPKCSNDINGGDPFKSDVNGFSRNSIVHNSYKIRMNMEHGPEDSFRAALGAVQSQSYYNKISVDLFACPICELCFVHPKRFLIHFKWHTFGLEIRNVRNEKIASLNSDFLVKEIMYNCYCSEIFPSMNELDDHVKKRHGFLKSSKDYSTCKNGIDPQTQMNNSLNFRTHSKTENISIPQERDVEYTTSISNPLKKTEGKEETQSDPNMAREIKINRQSKIRLINADEPEMAEIIMKIAEDKRCIRLEKHRLRQREAHRNETTEKRNARLERERFYKRNASEKQKRVCLERDRLRRQNETEEHRHARLERNRIRYRMKRKNRDQTRQHKGSSNESEDQ